MRTVVPFLLSTLLAGPGLPLTAHAAEPVEVAPGAPAAGDPGAAGDPALAGEAVDLDAVQAGEEPVEEDPKAHAERLHARLAEVPDR